MLSPVGHMRKYAITPCCNSEKYDGFLFFNSTSSINFTTSGMFRQKSLFRKIFPEIMTRNMRECDKNFERLQQFCCFVRYNSCTEGEKKGTANVTISGTHRYRGRKTKICIFI